MYTTLHSNILAKLAELLPDHTQLPYAIEIERNKKGKEKGFAVVLGESKNSDSPLTGQLTINLSIQVRLSDTYTGDKHSDSHQLAASHVLGDRCLQVFKALASAKLNSPGVRNVTLSDISDPTFLTESTIIRTLTIEANLRVPNNG